MKKEIKELADKLIKEGRQVYINDKDEVFTNEHYAKSSGIKYVEYKGEVAVEKEVTISKSTKN